MLEKSLLKIGAVSVILGGIIFFISDTFHGGHEPHNLVVTLPEYAANSNWVAAHLGQFVGQLLVTFGLVALYRSLAEGASGALALLGFFTTLASISTYAAVQGVDAVAIQFVAEGWVNAPAAEKEVAFRIAEAVRSIEIGLTSLSVLLMGITFTLFALALLLSDIYPRWTGWVTGVIGLLWIMVGLGFAYSGFAPSVINLSLVSAIGLFIWALIMVALMWRRAGALAPA